MNQHIKLNRFAKVNRPFLWFYGWGNPQIWPPYQQPTEHNCSWATWNKHLIDYRLMKVCVIADEVCQKKMFSQTFRFAHALILHTQCGCREILYILDSVEVLPFNTFMV